MFLDALFSSPRISTRIFVRRRELRVVLLLVNGEQQRFAVFIGRHHDPSVFVDFLLQQTFLSEFEVLADFGRLSMDFRHRIVVAFRLQPETGA